MPRRLLGIFMLLLVSVSVIQAQGDVVLLRVGADSICRNEFNYHFSKSMEKRIHVFMQTFVRFKQKVQWAKELRLDTLSSYCLQRDFYTNVLEQSLKQTEKCESLQNAEREWIKLAHITYPLKQHADKTEERNAKKMLDSLSVMLRDKMKSVHLDSMAWIQTRYLLDEWKCRLKVLAKDEFSEPFYSPLGIHIIAWVDKRYGNDIVCGVIDKEIRTKEIEDGLLVTSLEEYLEKNIHCTEAELEEFFNTYRDAYGWGLPHFKGAIIHCQNKKEAKRIKKYLKKYPETAWEGVKDRMPVDITSVCQIETGLYAIGSNPYVDKLVFKCGAFETLPNYPYTWVLGEKLKKGPRCYKDVREQVEKDCLKKKKEVEIEAFIQKKRVEIEEEVLKTVNHYGNK
ncbi:MAG: hypothetical protein IKU64_02715 [Bacteroides sp.]|nr:hypothetical protein [Bacteroides sp.]